MSEKMNLEVLAQLLAKVERAWIDNGDRTLIYQLAEQHPEYREHLYEFFEDLVLEPEKNVGEFDQAEERLDRWIQSSGIDIARAAAIESRVSPPTTSDSPVQAASNAEAVPVSKKDDGIDPSPEAKVVTWVMFLRRRTRQGLPSIAKKLENVTTEYLVQVSRHPNIVPLGVRQRIAQAVEQEWGIKVHESFGFLTAAPSAVRAASRSRAFDREPNTFEELLARSALTQEQISFWLTFRNIAK